VKVRAEARWAMMRELRGPTGRGSRHGTCSTLVREGREAVMPESGLEIDLAGCEVPCVLQEEMGDAE